MSILLDDILDLFSGTIRVTCEGGKVFRKDTDIFIGSKDDFWGDYTVQDLMTANNIGVQDIYVSYLESDDIYGNRDTIHVGIYCV